MADGIATPTNNSKATIGTSSERVLPSSKRNVLVLTNISTAGQKITVVQGNVAAILNEGIILSPGQSWIDADNSGYTCWEGEIQAISDAAGGILAISERGR